MALWTPAQLSPARWFDFSNASSVTTIANAISQVNDLSGNSDHLLQGDSAKRPTYVFAAQNNLNVASFDGTDDFLQLASDFSLGTAHSIFIACKNAATITAASSAQAILSGGSYVYPSTTTSEFLFNTGSVTGNITNERISSIVIAHSASAAQVYGRAKANADITTGFIVSTAYTTTADAFRGRYQGADDFITLSSPGSFSSGNTRYPTLLRTVGSRAGTAAFWNGQIWEVLVFASYLSQENTELIEGYLAQKWGLQESLPSTHPYKYNLLSSKFRSRSFFTRYAYKPAKPRNYSVIRVKETDYGNLRQGLVGAWCPSLPSGGSGNTLPDVSGYGNHGTLTNMSPDDWVSGQYGRALDFDGVDDKVSIPNIQEFVSGNQLTVSLWIKRNSAGAYYELINKFIATSMATEDGWLFRWDNNNKLLFTVAQSGNYGQYLAANPSTTVDWTHLAVIHEFGTATKTSLFFNGQVISAAWTGNGAFIPDANATADNIILGSQFYSNVDYNLLAGQLDDIRIYNRALTESEIKLLASRPGIGLRQESHRNTFYQFPSFQPALARRSSVIIGGGIT